MPPESVATWATILSCFPALEVRAALSTASEDRFGGASLDKVLRVLADRLWEGLVLPPPTDIALEEMGQHVWDNVNGGWSHPTVGKVVNRYGWNELYGGTWEAASVRKAQLRKVYDEEREREISQWIARISQVSQPTQGEE